MDNIDGLQGEVMHKSEKGRVGELERERERERDLVVEQHDNEALL